MVEKKENLFGSFDLAAKAQQQEQERIEARVTRQEAAPSEPKAHAVPLGRPRKRLDATSMTISISQAGKDLVKAYAFNHALAVSNLIHTWINQYCVEE